MGDKKLSVEHTLNWLNCVSLTLVYDQFHNILRLFDVLPIFPFSTSETIATYKHGIYELPNDLRLRILGNWEMSRKCLNSIEC